MLVKISRGFPPPTIRDYIPLSHHSSESYREAHRTSPALHGPKSTAFLPMSSVKSLFKKQAGHKILPPVYTLPVFRTGGDRRLDSQRIVMDPVTLRAKSPHVQRDKFIVGADGKLRNRCLRRTAGLRGTPCRVSGPTRSRSRGCLSEHTGHSATLHTLSLYKKTPEVLHSSRNFREVLKSRLLSYLPFLPPAAMPSTN